MLMGVFVHLAVQQNPARGRGSLIDTDYVSIQVSPPLAYLASVRVLSSFDKIVVIIPILISRVQRRTAVVQGMTNFLAHVAPDHLPFSRSSDYSAFIK